MILVKKLGIFFGRVIKQMMVKKTVKQLNRHWQ